MEFFNSLATSSSMDVFLKLSLALLFGAILGLERIFAHRSAGIRTYALVSMGSALLVITSEIMSARYLIDFGINPDPLKVASNIIVGVGFLGAGMIVFKDSSLMGLTTAAGLWLAAGIGIATGFGLFVPAFLATVFTLFIFTVLYYVEVGLLHIHKEDSQPDR